MARYTGRLALAETLIATTWLALSPSAASASDPTALDFVTHATFFSREVGLARPLDPQVFARDASAPAATGPQNIEHVAGYRPLLLSDPPDTKLFTAAGKPLPFTAGKWLGASGRVTITPAAAGGADIVATFSGLEPRSVYSLFENHFDQKPVGFTPLDGTGATSSFAVGDDGTATVKVHAPQVPTSVNAVLLVYHSDGKTHWQSRGEIGADAHHQLIAKVP